MSSLHQDRLLAEGSAPAKGTRRPSAPAPGKTLATAASAEAESQDNVPMPRPGTTRKTTSRTGSTPRATARATSDTRTRATSPTRATAAAEAASTTGATTRAATAKAATAKTASRKPAAKPSVARTAKTSTATVEQAVEAAPSTVDVVEAPAAPRRRPTPHKRPVDTADVPAPLELGKDADGAELTGAAETQAREVVVETTPAAVITTSAEGSDPADEGADSAVDRRGRLLRRRLPTRRRRPALYLAAALVGALGVSLTTGESQPAQAQLETVSQSVSIAEQLGIEAEPIEEITPEAATERLEELAISRSTRDAEQARAAQVQAEADRAAAAAAAAAAAEAARPKAVLPVQGARLTSGFGARWGTLHAGIDLAAPMMTPEYAVMDGVVLEAGPASGYGNVVYIQHANGDVTVYGHMEQILVSAGQVVKAGETIALLGNRGQSTGPHLHFEVHVGGINGQKIDPLPWLRERGIDV